MVFTDNVLRFHLYLKMQYGSLLSKWILSSGGGRGEKRVVISRMFGELDWYPLDIKQVA